MQPNYSSIIEHCNLWRNYDDIQDSWQSLESIIDYYGNNQDYIIPNAGPGHWNDPDMLIIGNFGLSYEQSKTQMALWAIMAAPLLMSVDLRTIRPEFKAILQNRKIIAVDQDVLGIQGRRIYKHKGIEIWSRPITPIYQSYYSYAVAFVNRRTDGTPSDVAVTLRELGLQSPSGYRVEVRISWFSFFVTIVRFLRKISRVLEEFVKFLKYKNLKGFFSNKLWGFHMKQ